MTRRFVITGTDTGIGKTVFSAALAAALDADYWKPVQAGLDEITDSETVASLGGRSADRILPEAYRLNTPCSPHRAAELDGVTIDIARLAVPDTSRPLVIEGAGGALVPLTRDTVFADVFALWQIPVVVVARTTLGTINHSLLTIEALRARRVPICGIAFVGDANSDSEAIITTIGRIPSLGTLPHLPVLDAESLRAAFAANFAKGDFR
jgi:dethiobiotin synthetase